MKNNNTLSQKKQILDHFVAGKKLTTYSAINHYGIYNLSARISELIHRDKVHITKRKLHTRTGKIITQYSF